MLNLSGGLTTDSLSEQLANLIATLHPEAGPSGSFGAIETARRAVHLFLRELRYHLRENHWVIASLEESDPGCRTRLLAIRKEHELLKQLCHDLCRRLRHFDRREARNVGRRYLAILLDHGAHEARVLKEQVRRLDPLSTARFTEALYDRMLRDAARCDRASRARESVADLHSLYVRLANHLQNSSDLSPEIEADHEHSCSR